MSKLKLPYLKPLVSLYILILIAYLYIHPWAVYSLSLLILIFGVSLAVVSRLIPSKSLFIAFLVLLIIFLFYFQFIPSPFTAFTDLKIPFGPSFLLTVFFIAGIVFMPGLLFHLLESRKSENKLHK